MRSENVIDEMTRLRLLEWDIHFETSSWGCKRGQIRRVTNQCATETINIHTLRDLLGVTECLWMCPECKDIDS